MGTRGRIGTLKYITPEKIAQASRLVTAGKILPWVFPSSVTAHRRHPTRFNPIHSMFRDGRSAQNAPGGRRTQGYGGSDDWIVMPLQCVTQWDSLAHVFDSGKMYNGYDATLVTSSGAAKNSIDKTKNKIAGRGVLLDVPRYKDVPFLQPGYAITVEDLEGTAATQRVEVRSGDILLVRTGHMSTICRKATGIILTSIPPLACRCTRHPGYTPGKSLPSAVTITPSRYVPRSCHRSVPFHICAIPNMGLTLGEIFYLEELAADCAADWRYEFLLVAPPSARDQRCGHADEPVRS